MKNNFFPKVRDDKKEVFIYTLKFYLTNNSKTQRKVSVFINDEFEIKINLWHIYRFWLYAEKTNIKIVFDGEALDHTFDPQEEDQFHKVGNKIGFVLEKERK